MARTILFPDWQNEQEHSAYPFTDDTTRTNGIDTLSNSVFLDARLYLIGAEGPLYLSSINVEAEQAVFTIRDAQNTRATGTYNFESGASRIGLVDEYGRPAGVLVGTAESLSFFSTWPLGEHLFTQEQAEFMSTVTIPTPQIGVRGFITENGTFFTKDVWLLGEQGVFFTRESPGVIRVDIVGDSAAKRKFCDALGDFQPTRFVRTLSGMGPNTYGDFKLLSGGNEALDTVLRIQPIQNGLSIRLIGGVLQDAED